MIVRVVEYTFRLSFSRNQLFIFIICHTSYRTHFKSYLYRIHINNFISDHCYWKRDQKRFRKVIFYRESRLKIASKTSKLSFIDRLNCHNLYWMIWYDEWYDIWYDEWYESSNDITMRHHSGGVGIDWIKLHKAVLSSFSTLFLSLICLYLKWIISITSSHLSYHIISHHKPFGLLHFQQSRELYFHH